MTARNAGCHRLRTGGTVIEEPMPDQPTHTFTEPVLHIIDDLVPQELFAEAAKLSAAKGWYFGHGSHGRDEGRFWKIDLEGVPVFDAIWHHVKERCAQMAAAPLRVLRQYANGHTYGLGGRPHFDDSRPGTFTLLYYPNAQWLEGWDGETVFYDERGEIALSVVPRPNRAVFFDSRIPHVGRAPSRQCPALRVTVAYKLEVVSGVSEPARRETLPARAHTERHHLVNVPAERVRRLVEEQLSALNQNIRLPGFRPGKIPMAILGERYGSSTRARVLERLAAEAVAAAPQGDLVVHVDVAEQVADVEFRLTVVHLPDLAEPELSGLIFERLTASESDFASAGVTADALAYHLKKQILDHLDQSYSFALPKALVEREFTAVWQAAQAHGAQTDADVAEFSRIAERRVRLGIVVTEMARRYEISGPGIEDQVLERLLSRARVRERRATAEELRDLA